MTHLPDDTLLNVPGYAPAALSQRARQWSDHYRRVRG